MKTSVLFIFSPYPSHLNKTTLIAKKYVSKGARVSYFLFGEADWLKKTTNAEVFVTRFWPFGFIPESENYSGLSYLSRHRMAKMLLEQRKNALREVFSEISPTVVYFDELCSNDVFLIADLLKVTTNIMLIPTLPNNPDSLIPPLYSAELPNWKWIFGWKLRQLKLRVRDIINSFTNPKYSSYWLNKNTRSKNAKLNYTFYAYSFPVFKGFKRWYLSAPEFDFKLRKLPENEIAVGPMIDRDRTEVLHPRVDYFLKKIQQHKPTKFIYCGFGLVILSYYKEEDLLKFYNKLNEMALRNSDWHILVTVHPKIIDKIKPSCFNIMFVTYSPQMTVLPLADLFITHGGGSVMEALQFGTPMLCVPAPQKGDFNGNATRIQFHGIGLTAQHTESIYDIEEKIKQILNDNSYKIRTQKLSQEIVKKYGSRDLNWIDLPM